MRKIIVDTDGNTIAMKALKSILDNETVCVQAVTAVATGLSMEDTIGNIVKTMGASEIPVFAGMNRPMVSRQPVPPLSSHKKLKGYAVEVSGSHAVDAILDVCSKEEVEIFAMGPLTNIALAIAKKPSVMKRVKKIWMFSGMVFHGNVGPMTEYNVLWDPESADYVLKSGIPITILPCDMGDELVRVDTALNPEKISRTYSSYTRIETQGTITFGASINDVRDRGRTAFLSQGTVLQPYNCTIVVDGVDDEIRMEV